jgi:hypothetical protein
MVKKFPVNHDTVRSTYYCVHKSLPLDPNPSLHESKSTLSYIISLRTIFILSSHLYPGLPSGFVTYGFLKKILYQCFISPYNFSCPVFLILLYLVTLIIFGEEYKLWSCPLHSFFSKLLYFLSFRSKCTPWHFIFRHWQCYVLPFG